MTQKLLSPPVAIVVFIMASIVIYFTADTIVSSRHDTEEISTAMHMVSAQSRSVGEPHKLYLPLLVGGSEIDSPPMTPVPVPTDVEVTVTPADVNPDYLEAEVLRITNDFRMLYGLEPLILHQKLMDAAEYHAKHQHDHNYFNHNSYERIDGELVFLEFWSTRILDRFGFREEPWHFLGENIAGGYTTPQKAVNAWMNSPGHKALILSDNSDYIGIGVYGEGNHIQWVQDFAGVR